MSGPELTICALNVENLFVSMAYHDGRALEAMTDAEWRALALPQLRSRQKPLPKLWGLARAISGIDPDIVMLSAVGGEDSLSNLNLHFLGARFDPVFVEGNSARGIDLGFLVRKGIGFGVEARSNRDTPIEVSSWHGKSVSRFSRDVAELRLLDGSQPRLVLLLAHLKSKLSTERDYRGKDVRTADAIALAEIYARRRAELPGVPVIVGGDFNAELSSLELELLKRTDLADFHDLLGTPEEERASYVHFDATGASRPMALDYLLVSPELRQRIVRSRSHTHRYRTFHDIPEALPSTPQERYRMPSDHYPLVLTIRLPELPKQPGPG